MIFNSFSFWMVFPFIFILYWLIPSKLSNWKKWFLIFVSYLLYMNWKPAYALILFSVTLVTFYGAKTVCGLTDGGCKKRLIIVLSTLGLLPLLFFKYYNFINESFSTLLSHIGLRFELPGLNWMVPVGISFFTFQSVSYLFDVYYGKMKQERSLTNYVLFVSFFPQVTSGPISKANELIPQIDSPKPFCYTQATKGLQWLLWGMFLKVVVADRLGLCVDTIYGNYKYYSGASLLLASIFYTLQIYGDFAGYSFMAIGIAKTLGINLINNFERPYFSQSVTEFWRRWHISLSRWLKDYVYIPLGGSRCSQLRSYMNIMVTFLVSGIWHGANWTFMIWGAMHGMVQVIEKWLGYNKHSSTWVGIFRVCITFTIVNIAWIFFRMPTIGDAMEVIGRMISSFFKGTVYNPKKTELLFYIIAISIMLLKETREEFFPSRFFKNKWVRFTSYVILFVMIIMMGVLDSGQFIYVSF